MQEIVILFSSSVAAFCLGFAGARMLQRRAKPVPPSAPQVLGKWPKPAARNALRTHLQRMHQELGTVGLFNLAQYAVEIDWSCFSEEGRATAVDLVEKEFKAAQKKVRSAITHPETALLRLMPDLYYRADEIADTYGVR